MQATQSESIQTSLVGSSGMNRLLYGMRMIWHCLRPWTGFSTYTWSIFCFVGPSTDTINTKRRCIMPL